MHRGAKLVAVGMIAVLAASINMPDPRAHAASPDGKTITYAVPRTITRLAPWAAGDTLHSAVMSHIYDNLVHLDASDRIVPQLATRWSMSPDAKVWTFELRRGVRFTDGTPLTAPALKQAYEWGLAPGQSASYAQLARLLEVVDSIHAVDEHMLRFSLKRPSITFDRILAGQYTEALSIGAIRKHGVEGLMKNPVGTGPFILKQWIPGSQLVMTRNPNYWGPAPRIDTIIFKDVPEEASMAVGFQTGEIDVAWEVGPATAAGLARDPNLVVHKGRTWAVVFVQFNTLKPPLSDVRVRQAVSHGIDRLSIVNGVLRGFGRVSEAPVARSIYGYCALKKTEYNPGKARELLREAGYPDGLDIPLLTLPRFLHVAQPIAQQLGGAGIRAKIEVMETARFRAARGVPAEQAPSRMLMSIFSSFAGTEDDILRALYVKDAWGPKGFNFSYYFNQQVESLLERAENAVQLKEQKELFCDINKILWRDTPHAWLYEQPLLVVWNKRLKGVEVPSTWEVNVRNAYWEK